MYIYHIYIYTIFPRKDVAATIYFSSTVMRRLFEGSYYSKYRRRGYYLFQLYRNAATIRGQLLFEVQTSRLLFISALPQCGGYWRAATIRSADVAATIYFSTTAMRRLFEGGYYSRCGIYSRKYSIYVYMTLKLLKMRLLKSVLYFIQYAELCVCVSIIIIHDELLRLLKSVYFLIIIIIYLIIHSITACCVHVKYVYMYVCVYNMYVYSYVCIYVLYIHNS